MLPPSPPLSSLRQMPVIQRLTLRLAPGYRPRLRRRSITITPSEGLPVVASARLTP